jgi:hypothetical protein
VEICFYCGEGKGVILFGKLKGLVDREAPSQVCLDHEPCDKCRAFMDQGIICIGVDEARSNGDTVNPYRDGNWCVVTEEAIRRIITPPELADDICKRRCAFIPTEAWTMIGLPKAKRPGARHEGKREGDND